MLEGENMTELAEKRVDTESSNVYVFPKVDSLANYLTNYVISKETFNFGGNLGDSETELLLRYYDDSRKRADRLVTEDEFVGITFDNLDIIKSLLQENKLTKRKGM